jgi:DNA-binding transcriptional LysR family regulator
MDRMTAMGVFVEVAERGSLTAAADTLNISRAMVTRYLAELEDWLGARLFHRTTRRITLTSAGEQALERCRRMLELGEDLEAAVSDSVDAAPRGQLRIACSASFGQSQLAVAVAHYVARFPRVRVDLLMADRTINLVEERIDLAIRITHELDPTLIARRLSVCRSLLCATPAYLAARGTPQRPEDLLRHSCLTHHFVGRSLWQLQRDGRDTAVTVAGSISANDAGVLLQMVLADAGIGLLPTYQIGPFIRSGELVVVLPEYHVPPMNIYGVYASRRQVPTQVRSFLDFLGTRFGEVPDWDRELPAPSRPKARQP